jgi:predicted MFS family arabinose efflux permease
LLARCREDVSIAIDHPIETSKETAPTPSRASLRGLDGLNFLMADVRDGVGPYVALFLKGSQHWAPGPIGVVMALGGLVTALMQVPAGLLVDTLWHKRLLVAISGLLVAAGYLSVVEFSSLPMVLLAQFPLGAASAVIPPAIGALSLGLVGRVALPARISRNEGFKHGGSLAAALLGGALGQYFGVRWVFYLVCGFALASAAVVSLIKPSEIDHELARGSDPGGKPPIGLRALLRRADLRAFLISVVLFHGGNAAMLPMAGQVLALRHPGSDTLALSACIIVAQAVMVGVAASVGWALRAGIGRKPIFLVALLMLPVRGVLFALFDNPLAVVAIQVLDGVAAGIFGVISVVIAADLMRGTGRFNLAQGLVALAVGLGGAASNLLAGYIVQWFGYRDGFFTLAAIAVAALVFFALCMPETAEPVASGRPVPQERTA